MQMLTMDTSRTTHLDNAKKEMDKEIKKVTEKHEHRVAMFANRLRSIRWKRLLFMISSKTFIKI